MTLPFTMPSADVFFTSPKRVFAHYFYSFPQSIDNQPSATDYYNRNYLVPAGEGGKFASQGGFLRARPLPAPIGTPTGYQLVNMQSEVSMALARGITGFTFDILNLADAMSSIGHLANLLAAAALVDTRFWIVPMLDMSALTGLTQAQAVQLIASFTHPSIARLPDGRILISAFNATSQPLAWWQGVITALNAQNVNIGFIPVMLGNPGATGPLSPISIGLGGWGTATPVTAAGIPNYMNPVLTQQFRPKDSVFWEASNSGSFRAGWMTAINGGSQYVQIITWSDFSESGQVQPHTDTNLATNIGTGFYDLTAYYAAWFATGIQPAITKDVLYWFYRKMKSTDPHPNQSKPVGPPVGPPEESNIELLAFLTSPGTVMINGTSLPAPAGITSLKAPTSLGAPKFALQRNGSNVFQFTGPVTIGPNSQGTTDLTYWSGSASV